MSRLSAFLALAQVLVSPAYASLGPTGDFLVVNKIIAPDGFNRS